MREFSRLARRVCAALIGVVFFVSGSLKLMDPAGAGLVVAEYFKFFHLGFLVPISKAVAFLLAFAEAIVGVALISGILRKAAAWAATGLTAFFTFVTLAILIGNPDMDCGCFGEAVHLTHAQTFVKNLVLCALCAVAFFPLKNLGEPRKRKYISFALVSAAVLALAIYSLFSLPLVDFTPYKAGAELLSSSDNPSVSGDDWVSTFIYEKDGKEGEFTLDCLPDSTWTFVRTETYRRNVPSGDSGQVPLDITDADGNYREDILSDGEVFAVSVPNPSSLKPKDWERISGFLSYVDEAGFKPYLLVSSSPDAFAGIVGKTSLPEDISSRTFFADHKALLTFNRSNGGAVWLSEGMIVRKFTRRNLPGPDKAARFLGKDPVNVMLNEKTGGRLRFQAYLLYSFALLLLL